LRIVIRSLWRAPRARLAVVGLALASAFWARDASAQTDYYNLDKGRPLRVEDAYATERYAVELQAAPLALSGTPGVLHYAPSLELEYGLLPGMELSLSAEAEWTRTGGESSGGLRALEISTLFNLNSETLGVPAFGVRVTGHLPVADEESVSAEVRGIVTRVLGGSWRGHVNGAWTLGEDAPERWWAGVALDYVLPFRSLLLLAETYYTHARAEDGEGRVHSAAGLRYQLGPRTGMDLGAGRDWTGTEQQDWYLTFGLTTTLAIAALVPR
jgi:hypothetical protein